MLPFSMGCEGWGVLATPLIPFILLNLIIFLQLQSKGPDHENLSSGGRIRP